MRNPAFGRLDRRVIDQPSVNAPVPEFLNFSRCIREHPTRNSLSTGDTGAITVGRHLKVTGVWRSPLSSGVQPTFVRHRNRALWLLHGTFIVHYLSHTE